MQNQLFFQIPFVAANWAVDESFFFLSGNNHFNSVYFSKLIFFVSAATLP